MNIPDIFYGIAVNLAIIATTYLILNRKIRIKTKLVEISNINMLNKFYDIYVESLKIRDDMNEIKYESRDYEQLEYVDTTIEEVKAKLMNNFFSILKKRDVKEIYKHPVYKSYDNTITLMLHRMRGICDDNFTEMLKLFNNESNVNDDFNMIRSEFEEWKEKIIFTQINASSEIIGQLWIENSIINRQESYDETKYLIPSIATNLSSVYTNAIMVQLKYSRKLKELTKKIADYMIELKKQE